MYSTRWQEPIGHPGNLVRRPRQRRISMNQNTDMIAKEISNGDAFRSRHQKCAGCAPEQDVGGSLRHRRCAATRSQSRQEVSPASVQSTENRKVPKKIQVRHFSSRGARASTIGLIGGQFCRPASLADGDAIQKADGPTVTRRIQSRGHTMHSSGLPGAALTARRAPGRRPCRHGQAGARAKALPSRPGSNGTLYLCR
jgi:hypothetical protein